jgi:hypothetical protein
MPIQSRDGILHRFTIKCESIELIDPASYASGQLMRDLLGRYVVLQAAGVAQRRGNTPALAPEAS